MSWLVRKKTKTKHRYITTPVTKRSLIQPTLAIKHKGWKVGALYSDHISRPPLVKLLLPWKHSLHVFQTPSLARPFLPPSTGPQAEGLCSHIVFIRAAERLEEESHSLLKRRSLNSLQTRQKGKKWEQYFYCLPMEERVGKWKPSAVLEHSCHNVQLCKYIPELGLPFLMVWQIYGSRKHWKCTWAFTGELNASLLKQMQVLSVYIA